MRRSYGTDLARGAGVCSDFCASALQRQGCSEETLTAVKLACLIRPTDSVILQQHLFTVYVHPSKSFEGGNARRLLSRVVCPRVRCLKLACPCDCMTASEPRSDGSLISASGLTLDPPTLSATLVRVIALVVIVVI